MSGGVSFRKGVTRRGFLTVAVSAVVAGVGAYYAGTLSAPVKEVTKSLTETVRETLTKTETLTRTVTTTLAPGAPVTTTVTTTITQPPTTTTVTKTATATTTVTTTVTKPLIPERTPEEQQKLIEAAKKEGKVTLYTDIPVSPIDAMAKLFTEKYGIPVDYWRGTSGKVAERFITEAEAGRWETDFVDGTLPTYCYMFKQRGLLQPYFSPELKYYPPYAYDPEGYYAGGYANIYLVVIGFNKNLVSDAEAPKSWTDLLDPKWKGKIGHAPPEVGGGHLAVYDYLRTKLGIDYLKKLAEQKIVKYTSGAVIAERLAAGEILVGITSITDFWGPAVLEGAPIKCSVPEETVATLFTAGIPKKVPHPNAAKLWMDHLLSLEGVTTLVNARGYIVLREGAPLPPKMEEISIPRIRSIKDVKIYPTDYIAAEAKMEEYGKEYKAIFG